MPARQNFAFLVAYDGRPYQGFQPQAGLPTIGGVLNSTLHRLGIGASTFGASRTDARVQAMGQVVSFQTRSDIDPAELEQRMNAELPATICVRALSPVPNDFHAHWSASGKTYRYRLGKNVFAHCRDEEKCRGVVAELEKIDFHRLKRAFDLLAAQDDLSAFSASNARDKGKRRTICPPKILELSSEGILVEIQGSGFGRYQIRNLMAAAMAVGVGVLDESGLLELSRGTSSWRPFRAPAEGLCLFRVHYPGLIDPFRTTFVETFFTAPHAIPFLETYLTEKERGL